MKSFRDYCLDNYSINDWDSIDNGCYCWELGNGDIMVDSEFNNYIVVIPSDEIESYGYVAKQEHTFRLSEVPEELARKHNPDYDMYEDHSNLYILKDSEKEIMSCCDCPFFNVCDQFEDSTVDWNAEEETYNFDL